MPEHLPKPRLASSGGSGATIDFFVASNAGISQLYSYYLLDLLTQTSSINTSYSYSPYGQTQATGESNSNNQQYTGREAGIEGEAGLYYYRARYYDPVLKRFISEDPIGLSGGLNVYAYVEGMPIMATDPSGNCPWCFGAVFGGLGGVTGGFFGLKAKRFQAWMNLQGALTYSPASQNWQPVLTGVGDVAGAYVGGSNVLFGY